MSLDHPVDSTVQEASALGTICGCSRGKLNLKRRAHGQWATTLFLLPLGSIMRSTNGGMRSRFWQRCIPRNGEISSTFLAAFVYGTPRSSLEAAENPRLPDGLILRGRAEAGKRKNSKRQSLSMSVAWSRLRTKWIAISPALRSKSNGTIKTHSSTVTSIIFDFYSTSERSTWGSSLPAATNYNHCLSRLDEERPLEIQQRICRSLFPESKEAVAEDAQ